MITGVNPDVHGILTNKMLSPSDQPPTQNWFFPDIKFPTITQVCFSSFYYHSEIITKRLVSYSTTISELKSFYYLKIAKDNGMIVAGVSWPVSVGGPYHM